MGRMHGGGPQVISLWIWLSYRFDEEYFPGRDRAQETSERIIGYMSAGLERMFGPTAALTSPKAQAAVCSRFAGWTNGAKQPAEMAGVMSRCGGAGGGFWAVPREPFTVEAA
jgi:hypothetical protein